MEIANRMMGRDCLTDTYRNMCKMKARFRLIMKSDVMGYDVIIIISTCILNDISIN